MAAAPAAEVATPRTLVFSHANGFPTCTYRLLFEVWREAGWRVVALPRIGHDPAYPVTNNWPHLREELLHLVQREAPQGDLHLVGHSLGGFLSLMAASRLSARVRAVVLLDSPIIAGWRAHSLHVGKLTGLMRRVSPSRVSQRRRWHWPDAEHALRHFQTKSVFARWDPRVLHDYVHGGTEPNPQAESPAGVRLAFHREIETRIYDTLPHTLATTLRRHPLRCPVSFIGGTQSDELRRAGMAATRALVRERLQWIEGSHLFPMERPLEAAQAVLLALQAGPTPPARG